MFAIRVSIHSIYENFPMLYTLGVKQRRLGFSRHNENHHLGFNVFEGHPHAPQSHCLIQTIFFTILLSKLAIGVIMKDVDIDLSFHMGLIHFIWTYTSLDMVVVYSQRFNTTLNQRNKMKLCKIFG